MPKNDTAGIDMQDFHDTAKDLAERCLAAGSIWATAKREAAARKVDYDELVEKLVAFAGEVDAPETPLLDAE